MIYGAGGWYRCKVLSEMKGPAFAPRIYGGKGRVAAARQRLPQMQSETRRHLLPAGIVLPELFSFYGKHPEGRVSSLPAFPVNNLIYLHHVDLVHLEVRPD